MRSATAPNSSEPSTPAPPITATRLAARVASSPQAMTMGAMWVTSVEPPVEMAA